MFHISQISLCMSCYDTITISQLGSVSEPPKSQQKSCHLLPPTPADGQVRPMWMKPLELKVTLCSDHPKDPQLPGSSKGLLEEHAPLESSQRRVGGGKAEDLC